MLGILGLPINEQILEIMRGVSERIASEASKVDQHHQHNSGKHIKKASKATLLSSAKIVADCPRCLGAGFRHDSSAKHDKKQKEKCKNCITCKGRICFLFRFLRIHTT